MPSSSSGTVEGIPVMSYAVQPHGMLPNTYYNTVPYPSAAVEGYQQGVGGAYPSQAPAAMAVPYYKWCSVCSTSTAIYTGAAPGELLACLDQWCHWWASSWGHHWWSILRWRLKSKIHVSLFATCNINTGD
jgi:hypothetical protein